MNRFALGALGVAAVLGTSGGVALAAAHDPAPLRATGSPAAASSSAAPTAVPSAARGKSTRAGKPGRANHAEATSAPTLEGDPGGPLYAVGDVIHDGTATIPLRAGRKIDAFAQAAGGYVVATAGPTAAPFRHDLWYVRTDRLQRRIGTVDGGWDLSPDGRSVVGTDHAGHVVTVWDVSSGNVVGQWDHTTDATDQAVFVGSEVYINDMKPGDRLTLSAWDYQADTTRTISKDGLAGMTASPFGRYLAGSVGDDGHASTQRENTCAAVRSTPLASRQSHWHSCEWSRAVVNADGDDDKVLLTSQLAGREASFAVTDADTGPDRGLTSLHPSATVLGASWATSRSVMLSEHVQGSTGPGAYQLESCGMNGSCHVVARGDHAMLPPVEG